MARGRRGGAPPPSYRDVPDDLRALAAWLLELTFTEWAAPPTWGKPATNRLARDDAAAFLFAQVGAWKEAREAWCSYAEPDRWADRVRRLAAMGEPAARRLAARLARRSGVTRAGRLT